MAHARWAAAVAATVGAGLLFAGAVAAAAPVQGSIAGPVTAVRGKTFAVKTTLSPTGSSKVTVTAKTTIHEQAAGRRGDLKKGLCVMASGTKKGAVVAATRISLTQPSGGSCTGPAGGRGARGTRPGGGAPPSGGSGRGFSPPANAGFAFGTIAAVKGSTLTVKDRTGSTKVTVTAKTRIGKTVRVKASAIRAKLCAFVRGTSGDKGVTVTAQDVSLSKPVSGSCSFRRRGPH